jgi:hypothetical protein
MATDGPKKAQGLGLDKEVEFWGREIDDYERMTDKWLRRVRKIVKRYKDIRTPREEAITRFNVLWANTQIRMPALYARNPKASVERRYKDKDPIGRVTSEILERSIQYTLDVVNPTMLTHRQVVLDEELSGRGTVWVRYVPHIEHKPAKPMPDEDDPANPRPGSDGMATGPQLGGSTSEPGDEGHASQDELAASGVQVTNDADSEADEDELTYEETLVDYVATEDFGHTWARTWDEVRAVWRKVYLDREELMERFCGKGMLTKAEIKQIPLDWSPRTLTDAKVPMSRKKAVVYEIWDKHKREVIWVIKNFRFVLDTRPDPCELKDFFPCPRPIYANLANDDLIPVPNFAHYQDQANEVDDLSSRITSITKALKVAGVRDTSAEGLDRLLSEGVENQLIPVEGWAAHKEKGGLAGVYELLPMEEIATTLGFLKDQRQQLIDDIYQLTGISDIVRGLSDPNETATAQQLKGQFSVLRIQDAQQEVQRFCRDEVHIIGEMIAKYSIETLKGISGVKLLTNAEKQQIQLQQQHQAMLAALQQAQAQQAPPGAPPGGGGPPGAAPPHPPGPPGTAPGAPPAAAPPAPPQPAAGPPPPPGGPGAAGMNPAAPGMAGTPAPGSAPVSPQQLELMSQPTWEEVEGLLRNPVVREFRLDIETDSTVRMDEEAEKQSRLDFLEKATGFLTQLEQAGQMAPELVPMLCEVFMWTVRAFTSARSIEQTFDDAMDALQKAAKQPKPDPEAAKAQMEQQTALAIAQGKAKIEMQARQAETDAETKRNLAQQQAQAQQDQQKAQLDMHVEQFKAQLKAHTDQAMETQKMHFEAQKAQFDHHADMQLETHKANLGAREQSRQMAHERMMGVQSDRSQLGLTREKGKQAVAVQQAKPKKAKAEARA